MQPALFDASIYISALRRQDDALLALRSLAPNAPLWLSAVVLEELYAGVSDLHRRVVERLERDFAAASRVVTPNLRDWTQTGRVLWRLAADYDYEQIGRARLTNDALIATSAGRMGIRVLTRNERDFRRLAESCSFRWELAEIE
jgi:predicted nucleic acid-binding protein